MKVLFLPHSFPGPFRGVATKLAESEQNKVLFVTNRARTDVRIPNVGRILINQPPKPNIPDRAEFEAVRSIRRASHMANCLLRLKNQGFNADIVISNAGLGYALYINDIFPDSFFICYAEGFQEQGQAYTLFSKKRPHPTLDFAPEKVRNLFQLNTLHESHMAYTSTNWQKSLYPKDFTKKIQVFHEGIDTDFFIPRQGERFCVEGCDLSHVEELVTFSGRSMETPQSLPVFLHAVPSILQKRPKCHIIIMSANTQENNPQSQKWLETLIEDYDIDTQRIHFINFRPYVDYRRLLQASSVHVYLSAPLALSSGIFEAMSCECLMIAGDTGPINEVVNHGKNAFLYDQNDSNVLADTTIELLERRSKMACIRKAARKTITEKYNVHKQTHKMVDALLNNYEKWKSSTS